MKIITKIRIRKGIGLCIAFILLHMTLRFSQNNASVWTSLDHRRAPRDNSTADLFRHVLHQLSRARHTERGGVDKDYVLVSNVVGPTDDYIVETQGDVNSLHISSKIVTLSVHCTDNNLHYLHDLSVFWAGPISIAVFTYGTALMNTITHVLQLHLCNTSIQNQVTFHLVVPLNEIPEHFVVEDGEAVHVKCTERKHSAMLPKNYNNTDVPYPSNVLRNLALENVRTPYVLNADIDMLPSENLYNNLVTFLKSFNGSKHHTTDKMAFVLPAMETNVTLTKPLSKEKLLRMWTKNRIRPFYWKVCKKCHIYMDFARWISLPKRNSINPGYEMPWRYPWEPFYVSRKSDLPRFNEVFKQYGLNRLSQLCEMHMADYNFVVLDTGFLVHRGLKERVTFHQKKHDENIDNMKYYQRFKTELLARYSNTTRRCTPKRSKRSSMI